MSKADEAHADRIAGNGPTHRARQCSALVPAGPVERDERSAGTRLAGCLSAAGRCKRPPSRDGDHPLAVDHVAARGAKQPRRGCGCCCRGLLFPETLGHAQAGAASTTSFTVVRYRSTPDAAVRAVSTRLLLLCLLLKRPWLAAEAAGVWLFWSDREVTVM